MPNVSGIWYGLPVPGVGDGPAGGPRQLVGGDQESGTSTRS